MKCESIIARKTTIDHMKSKELKAHTVHSVKLFSFETATQLSLLDANIKEIELRKKALIDFCDSMDKEFLERGEMAKKKRYLKLCVCFRGGSRTAATSKMERFVIIVNGWKPLTIITKRSILDVAAALDPLVFFLSP